MISLLGDSIETNLCYDFHTFALSKRIRFVDTCHSSTVKTVYKYECLLSFFNE